MDFKVYFWNGDWLLDFSRISMISVVEFTVILLVGFFVQILVVFVLVELVV